MILIFIALLVVSIFFPPAWLAFAGYAIYVFSSRKSRRDEAVESRIKKLISAGIGYSTFSDLYFDAARKYAEDKGGTSEQDYASVKMIVSDRLYSVSFMNDGRGGTNISVRDWQDVEREIEQDLQERKAGRTESHRVNAKKPNGRVSPSEFVLEYVSAVDDIETVSIDSPDNAPSWSDTSEKVNEFCDYVLAESIRVGVAQAYAVGMILQDNYINFAFSCAAAAEKAEHGFDFQKNVGVFIMQLFWEKLPEEQKVDFSNTVVTKEWVEGMGRSSNT